MHAFKDHQRFQSGWPPQALTRAAERCLSGRGPRGALLALLQRSLASPGSHKGRRAPGGVPASPARPFGVADLLVRARTKY